MKIAIIGLGKMGGQIARKLHDGGHDVIVNDHHAEHIATAVAWGATPANSRADVVAAFDGNPAVIWLMIPAGAIDDEIKAWADILPAGSILIDGGNSDYRGDPTRANIVAAHGAQLLDVGTSGGVWGYENGFAMMVGGNETAYQTITPLLDALAKPRGGQAYFGTSGSGHYVKMVHNAIEYGMMESLAEGYRVLKDGPYQINLAKAGDIWQDSSVITSWLNDLTRQTLHENPNLDHISGGVAESGEARWTIETAHRDHITLPAIEAALDVRLRSQSGETNFATKLLAAMRNKFGGHDINGQ